MRWAYWMLLALQACSESREPPPDAGLVGAGPDAAHDAAGLVADAGDAGGPGPCGGEDRLEVRATRPGGDPARNVIAYLRCGDGSLGGNLDDDGRIVFEGLDLAGRPVDVTVFDQLANLPVASYLGVDASSGGRLDVPLVDASTYTNTRTLRGRVEFSEPGTLASINMPGSYFGTFDASPYLEVPLLADEYRLTATEYRPEGDALVPLSFVDLRFPAPPFEDGPDVVFVPGGSFASASVDLLFEDPRLAQRLWPSEVAGFTRGPVFVFDVDPGEGDRRYRSSLVGMTTLLESTETRDRAEVHWWESFQGTPLTVLYQIDRATHWVYSIASLPTTPDAIGTFDMPAPPSLDGLEPDVETALGELRVTFVRPDGYSDEADRTIDIIGEFTEGYPFQLLWRIHLAPASDEIRFPMHPSIPLSYLLSTETRPHNRLRMDAMIESPTADGLGTVYGSDGRYLVLAE